MDLLDEQNFSSAHSQRPVEMRWKTDTNQHCLLLSISFFVEFSNIQFPIVFVLSPSIEGFVTFAFVVTFT